MISLGETVPNAHNDGYWSTGTLLKLPVGYTEGIFSRDLHTCRFCGFHSKKYQSVIVKNGSEWLLDSVLTACIFCAQSFSIQEVPDMKSGAIIYSPEISQVQLNQIVKIIYVCRLSNHSNAEKAKQALDKLMGRRKKALSMLTDNPEILIKELGRHQTRESHEKLCQDIGGFRLLSLDRRIVSEAELEFNQFPQILAYWRSKDGPFAGVKPERMDLTEFDALMDVLD